MAEKFPTPQERAMAWLLEATEIGGISRPETALYAYQAGFTAALDLCIEIEQSINDETEETDDLAEAYMDGAERQPTNEEIEAGAKAFYEALKPDSYPQWDSDCALRAEYYDAMRLAVKAMQGKAAEE